MRALLPLSTLLLAACGGQVEQSAATSEGANAAAATGMAPMAATPALPADATPAMRAYAEAAERMHHGMAAIDRDPDIAFAKGMIPHHQGAIDMARVELEHGKDPEMRKLAEAVIAAQEQEIAGMNRWLAERGAAAAAATGAPAHPH